MRAQSSASVVVAFVLLLACVAGAVALGGPDGGEFCDRHAICR